MRPGSLGKPKRGVGRLALETGAPVVPVAVIGTEAIRRGWRIRPHKVRIRAGRAAALPAGRGRLAGARGRGDRPDLAVRDAAVGVARRAAADPPRGDHRRRHVGHEPRGRARARGTRGRPRLPHARAGRGARARRGGTTRYLPGVELPDAVKVMRAAELELRRPRPRLPGGSGPKALPAVLAAHGERIPRRAGLLVLSKGLVPPLGTLPSAFASERCRARAVAVLGGPVARRRGARARRLGRARLARPGRSPASSRTRSHARRPRRHDHHRRHRRRARRLRQERGRARGRGRVGGGPERRRRRGRQGVRRGRRAGARARRPSRDVRRPRRRRRPGRDRGRRRARATAAPASCSPRGCRRRRSRRRSDTLPRRSTRCRCWPRRLATRGSRRPRSTGWRRSWRGGSSPSSGPRR